MCSKEVILEKSQELQNSSIEISARGKWVSVPALRVDDYAIVVWGRWLKTASVHDEEWMEDGIDDPRACLAKLRDRHSHNISADIFTFSQKLPATVPQHQFRTEWDSVAAIRLESYQKWWEELPQETRKNVRRSQKRGVVIEVKRFGDDVVREIMEVNNDSPVRQGVPNVHYGKSFEQVKRDHCSFADRSDFICAYAGGEVIGFLKLVYRKGIASILQLTPKPSHSDKRPANAMLAKAVEICAEKKISHVIYGMFNYGNKTDCSLREFKERNGFVEILVPRYFVPLTAWGRMCIALNLHRGLHGILPPFAIKACVSARAMLYNLARSLKSRCSSVPEQPTCNRQTERSTPPAGSKSQVTAVSSLPKA